MEIFSLTLLGWLVIYFFVNRLQVDPQRRMDLGTSYDQRIPYIPLFALVYFSTYIFIAQPFIMLSDPRQFYLMLASFAAISLISSLIHASLPSRIERVEQVNSDRISGRMLGLFQRTCKPYGNFPSMHVGLSVPVVAANYMVGGPGAGSIMLVWAVLIALSTLYTKQHYLLDVLAGMLGGILIFALMYLFIMR